MPYQFDAFCRVSVGDLMNRTALRFEIIDQASSILPVNEGSGPRDSGQSLTNLLGNLCRTFRAGQLKANASLYAGVAAAHLDQQLGQAFGAQRLKILFIQGFLGSHWLHPFHQLTQQPSRMPR